MVQGHWQDHCAGWWTRSVQAHCGLLKDFFLMSKALTNTTTTNSTSLPSCKASTLGSIAATLESTLDQTSKPSQDSQNPARENQSTSIPLDKKNGKLERFSMIESIIRNVNSLFIGKAMTTSKLHGNLLTLLKEPVPPSEPTGLTPIMKLFPSVSLRPITNVGQLGQSRNPIMFLYYLNLTLTDFGQLSKTLTTPKPKLVIPFFPLMKPSSKPNGNHVPFFYFFSVRGNVTESTIMATIDCPEIGYCLFGISLVMHIPYHVPCTLPVVIVSYWVVPSFACLFSPLAPGTQLRYSTLPTMYYRISTSVAIPCLFDSITCVVSYILSPLYVCFRT